MTSADIALLIALLVALLAAAFLAAAEASLLRVSEFRARSLAEEADDPRATRLDNLLKRLPGVVNLILLLALVAQISAASITGVLAQRWFGNIGVTVATVVLTFVLFVYGEAIPKTFAIRHADETALRVAGPISVLERLLRPIVSFLVWIADIQLPGKGTGTTPTITESELRLLAGRAAYEGEITPRDRALIERAFRFGDRRVDDIMIPRPDIVALPISSGIDEAIEVALRAGHRRLPVFEDSLETISGVVRLRDLITARDQPGVSLEDLAFAPLIIPESMSAASLLEEMQATRTHIAIVVDEYGSTSGLVTVEDAAEELLGSISEEPRPPEFEQIGDGLWRVAGSLPVEDLGQIGMEIPKGEWKTVAGLMMGRAGTLLQKDDVVEVEEFRLKVEEAVDRRVTWVLVESLSVEEGPAPV